MWSFSQLGASPRSLVKITTACTQYHIALIGCIILHEPGEGVISPAVLKGISVHLLTEVLWESIYSGKIRLKKTSMRGWSMEM